MMDPLDSVHMPMRGSAYIVSEIFGKPVRCLGRNVADKSRVSLETVFASACSVTTRDIGRGGDMKQKEQNNTGNQTRGFKRQ